MQLLYTGMSAPCRLCLRSIEPDRCLLLQGNWLSQCSVHLTWLLGWAFVQCMHVLVADWVQFVTNDIYVTNGWLACLGISLCACAAYMGDLP